MISFSGAPRLCGDSTGNRLAVRSIPTHHDCKSHLAFHNVAVVSTSSPIVLTPPRLDEPLRSANLGDFLISVEQLFVISARIAPILSEDEACES
jgi:hypothetical protein